jgi:hypothetical protein
MTQISTHRTKISTVMRSAAFVRGFKEARNNAPMDYDAYCNFNETHKRWSYERGRQFGLIYSGSIKNGNKVILDAIFNYNQAHRNGWIR